MKTQFFILLLLVCGTFQAVNGQPEWKTKANRSLSGQCKAVVYKEKIYVSSINTENHFVIEEYNPSTDTWELKKAVSEITNFGEYSMASTDEGIFIMGGYLNNVPSNKMIKYDVEKDVFTTLDNMPTGLDCATAISVNNLIYVMCGSPDNNIQSSNKVYQYDPEKALWSEKQAAPVSRREAQAVVIQSKIYLFGGFGSTNSNTMNIYDPVTDVWTTGKNDVALNKYLITMGVLNDKIYLITGIFSNNAVISEELFMYDPVTDLAIKISDRTTLTWLMGTVSINDSIYIIGGIKGVFPTGEKQNSTLLLTNKSDNQTGYKNFQSNEFYCFFDKPTRNININTSRSACDNLDISIYNLLGKHVLNKQFSSGASLLSIDSNSLTTGIYIVSVKSGHCGKSFMIPID